MVAKQYMKLAQQFRASFHMRKCSILLKAHFFQSHSEAFSFKIVKQSPKRTANVLLQNILYSSK